MCKHKEFPAQILALGDRVKEAPGPGVRQPPAPPIQAACGRMCGQPAGLTRVPTSLRRFWALRSPRPAPSNTVLAPGLSS